MGGPVRLASLAQGRFWVGLQEERLRQQQVLSLYKAILSEGPGKSGLRLLDFELAPTEEPASYRFSFVVAQVLKDFKVTEAVVRLTIEGADEGEETSLALGELSEDGQDSVKLHLRHFQRVGGLLRLPQRFVPRYVVVEVTASNRRLAPLSRVFEWQAHLQDAVVSAADTGG